MTIVKVELLDDQAAALEAKAAAQGWSLGDWFRFIADQEVRPRKGRYNLAELIQRCDPTAELSDEDREWVGSSTG